jgi:VanZ family protein
MLVEKTLLYTAIGYLTMRNIPEGNASRPTLAWAACSAMAMLIEVGKLFFAGRAPNIDNVVFSSLGALVGVVLVPPLATTGIARRHARPILVILMLCIIAYVELSPFDWLRSADEIRLRIAKIEWLPFSSYYSAEPQAALFDLAKKLFLLGPLGFLIAAGDRNGSPRKRQALATAAGLLVGLILEAGQIGLQSRNPSLTDILLFGGAAWAGAVVFERYRRIRDLRL